MSERDPERQVLGTWLLYPETIDRAHVTPADFAKAAHAALAEYLVGARRNQGLSCVEEVIAVLGCDRILEQDCGGLSYVASLPGDVTTEELYPHVERIVREQARRRNLVGLGRRLQQQATTARDPAEAESALRSELDRLEALRPLAHTAEDIAPGVWCDLDEQSAGRRQVYIPTGWADWDGSQDWQGWSAEGVTLVLARSGMGKTSVLNSTAVLMAAMGLRVYLHGTETSPGGRLHTMALGIARVDPRRWSYLCRIGQAGRDTDATYAERERYAVALRNASSWLGTLPLVISGAGLTVEQVCAEAQRRAAADALDVALIDYLQDFRPSDGIKRGEKGAQTDHASRTLKDCAARIKRPIVCTAQVSGEKDTGKGPGADPFPQLWDCQWSSGAHQDAEEVFAINRGDYWKDRLGRAYRPDQHGPEGRIDILARKRRSGPLKALWLPWCGFARWVGDVPRTGTGV